MLQLQEPSWRKRTACAKIKPEAELPDLVFRSRATE